MSQFDSVSVVHQANVYFDGKCVSHTVVFPDGTRKSVGVILASTLKFNVGAPEIMECVGGSCRARVGDETEWTPYTAGQSFSIPENSYFEIEVSEAYHYICHFG